MAQFERYMISRGKRMTRERQFVAEAAFASTEPINKKEFRERLWTQAEQNRLSRSSVVRIMQLLEESKLVQFTEDPDNDLTPPA